MKRVGDRFVVEAPLGAGGMGSIFLGRDERLGQRVAIKILKRAHLEDPVLRERFRREARSLAQIRHPGIVTVLDSGETEEGDLYTVLALVAGETLEALLERGGRLPLEDTIPIADAILGALAACHAVAIVHRDVKPSNVMVSREADGAFTVTLIDFGLAHLGGASIEKLTETGVVQGTPAYMAPEQCRGEDVGPASDVYATGIVLHEMLAGEGPFRGRDAATLMAQHLFVEPPPLELAAPDAGRGIAAAVRSALAKRPEDRPTAGELRAALAAAARGTDRETRASEAAVLRHHVGGLPRHERAIGSRSDPAVGALKAPVGTVAVWIDDPERSAAIRSCLGTAGLASFGVTGVWSAEERVDAVVVSSRDGVERLRHLRSARPRLPILIVDVAGPEETTNAIRSGASDMLLREAPDAELVPKVQRFLRRGPR